MLFSYGSVLRSFCHFSFSCLLQVSMQSGNQIFYSRYVVRCSVNIYNASYELYSKVSSFLLVITKECFSVFVRLCVSVSPSSCLRVCRSLYLLVCMRMCLEVSICFYPKFSWFIFVESPYVCLSVTPYLFISKPFYFGVSVSSGYCVSV